MTARRFDPEQNRQEILALYGPQEPTDWNKILGAVDSTDNRDLRDARKLGQRILRKVARRTNP